jgi:hypothetical protein
MADEERRRVGGGRQGVVHEGAGEQLALAIVCERLPQGLGDAMRHRAVDLPLHDEWIDHRAAVLDHGVFPYRHPPGARVHLNRGHVHRAREGRPRGVEDFLLRQALAGGHEIADAEAASGHAAHADLAAHELEVGRARLQPVRREGKQAAAHPIRGAAGRAAQGDAAAAGKGAAPRRREVRVDLTQDHRVEGHAQTIGHELGHRGGVPLTL